MEFNRGREEGIMITDNYIKMCEQDEKIQKLWKPKLKVEEMWGEI
jgi:hypothetical protein